MGFYSDEKVTQSVIQKLQILNFGQTYFCQEIKWLDDDTTCTFFIFPFPTAGPLSSSVNNFCKLLRIHKIVSYLTGPLLSFFVCAQHFCDFGSFCKLAEIHSQYFWGWSGVWLSLCCLYGLASNHPTNQPSNLKGSDSLNPPPPSPLPQGHFTE